MKKFIEFSLYTKNDRDELKKQSEHKKKKFVKHDDFNILSLILRN